MRARPSDGGEAKCLTSIESGVQNPVWFLNGKKIAFISNMDEYPDISHFENIYVMTSEGGEPEILWEGEKASVGHTGNLAWSPDGKYIVFAGRVIDDTSNIDYRDHSVTAGKNPWEDVEYFMEKSPISHVENVTTPLLLIHSEQDYRCPMDNAEQMFTALKKLRKTVEFVRFPGSHGFGRIGKPKHRIQRLQHVLRWFDRYLK